MDWEWLLEVPDLIFVKHLNRVYKDVYQAIVPKEKWASRQKRDDARRVLVNSLVNLHGMRDIGSRTA